MDDNIIPIDSLLLFQRICVLKKSYEKLKTYITFELVPNPLTLFEDEEMRKTKKTAFYDLFPEVMINVNKQKFSYVINKEMLLHRCKWQLDENFGTICECYVRYVHNNYGHNLYVVFDVYQKKAQNLRKEP